MANCWKRVTHRQPPESATIGRVNRDGVASAVWTDSKGNRHKRDVSKAADGGWRLLMENYSVKYRDHRDILVTETTKFKNKELAERYLSEKLDLAERVRSGRISAAEVRTLDRARLPVSQLIDEFVATISRKLYRDTTALYLRRFLEFNPNVRPVEIDSRCCQRWVDSLVADGAGSSTLSACRAALSRFTGFLYKTDVLAQPTVLVVTLPKLAARKPRRAFTKPEFERFLAAVETEERRLTYLFAAVSGLRAKEISCVTVADLRGLGTNQPCVMLSAEWTKNRKSGVQPLPPVVGTMLAGWIDSKGLSGDDKLFRMPVRADMSDWFLADLRRAGISQIVNGLRLNFHSLRKSFISWMMAGGESLRVVQLLARHSNPALTASTYTDERLLDGRSALASLPAFSVTPTVTPTPGDTSEQLITPDNSTGSSNSLFQAGTTENQVVRESGLAYPSHMPENRILGLFSSASVELVEDRDTRIDTLVDEAMVNLSGGGLGLSRNDLALLFMKLATKLASTVTAGP